MTYILFYLLLLSLGISAPPPFIYDECWVEPSKNPPGPKELPTFQPPHPVVICELRSLSTEQSRLGGGRPDRCLFGFHGFPESPATFGRKPGRLRRNRNTTLLTWNNLYVTGYEESSFLLFSELQWIYAVLPKCCSRGSDRVTKARLSIERTTLNSIDL